MARNGKAGYRLTHGSGSKTHFTGGETKAFSSVDYTDVSHTFQCFGCSKRDVRVRQLERLAARLSKHIDQLSEGRAYDN